MRDPIAFFARLLWGVACATAESWTNMDSARDWSGTDVIVQWSIELDDGYFIRPEFAPSLRGPNLWIF